MVTVALDEEDSVSLRSCQDYLRLVIGPRNVSRCGENCVSMHRSGLLPGRGSFIIRPSTVLGQGEDALSLFFVRTHLLSSSFNFV